MSTPELEQAIAATKWRGVEANISEIISKMLEVDEATIARIVFAWEILSNKTLVRHTAELHQELHGGLPHGDALPEDVRHAITQVAARALRRSVIRMHMERGLPLEVPFQKLVSEKRPNEICNGCTWQLECVRDNLSDPKRCLSGAHTYAKDQPDPHRPRRMFQFSYAVVTPIAIEDAIVIVTAEHPRGTFRVNVMDVRL